jgi:hypothetical protein
MSSNSPAHELAGRLRKLRLEHWGPDYKLTQGALGAALGGSDPLSTATVASWENKDNPKLPQQKWLLAYAQFFATRRSVAGTPPGLVPVQSFAPEEQASYDALRNELFLLHAAARGEPEEEVVARRSWLFADSGPVTIVCARLPEEEVGALGKPDSPNYTGLHTFGDADALIELWGHVRMENPTMKVSYKSAPEVGADDLSGHVVIIGGIGWNEVTRGILELTKLPVTQKEDPDSPTGEIFAAEIDGEERKYLPKWSEAGPRKLIEDVGLLVRMPNPLNSNRTLTMCNGIHSRGVVGAVRSLTDERLRESNERYISGNFPHNQHFGILMRITVIEGRAMTPDFSIADTVLYQWPTASGKPSADRTGSQARR